MQRKKSKAKAKKERKQRKRKKKEKKKKERKSIVVWLGLDGRHGAAPPPQWGAGYAKWLPSFAGQPKNVIYYRL